LTLQEQVEPILENRGQLFATTAKGKVTCPDSAPNHSLITNLSHYGSDAFAEVHNHDNMNNNAVNQAEQVMSSSQQSNVVNHSEAEITSDSNIIPYSQYVIESQ
ncbi:hypothetical protein Tco_1205027, partial [Tanacetum coccineum]